MNTIMHCIYASKASPGFREDDLAQVLDKSRCNNAARGVTGILLYVENNFFQVLEGAEADVTAIYDRICLDGRHGRVTQIIREPIFERDFPDWTMGYAHVNVADVNNRVGENDFFTSATCIEKMSPGRARKLLAAFRHGRWRADQTGMHQAHSRVA